MATPLTSFLAAVRAGMLAALPARLHALVDQVLDENRAMIERFVAQALERKRARAEAAARPVPAVDAPSRAQEPQTKAARTAANLMAMKLVAEKPEGELLDAEEREIVRRYSGWGGLSIEENQAQFPAEWRAEKRGLVHEYYTPQNVCDAVAHACMSFWRSLPRVEADGGQHIRALEPSAGIGRFLEAFGRRTLASRPRWHAVEYSTVSGRMLQALHPEAAVTVGPFEGWVAEHEERLGGRVSLVVSNPPYGPRGPAWIYDESEIGEQEQKRAYAYFLRRGLSLLAPGGVGIYLIPTGLLTGASARLRDLRRKVLVENHLMGAFRLPSGIFPGAMLVTDLSFWRRRDGRLADVAEEDQAILEGGYFREHPAHILGREVGREDEDEDDARKKPRWGYQVLGEFDGLPSWQERPLCQRCTLHVAPAPRRRPAQRSARAAPREGLAAEAAQLGARVREYSRLIADATPDGDLLRVSREQAVSLWSELVPTLEAWAAEHGAPQTISDLAAAAHDPDVQRFLQAFEGPALSRALTQRPVYTPEVAVSVESAPAIAAALYRAYKELSLAALMEEYRARGGRDDEQTVLRELVIQHRWGIVGGKLEPPDIFTSGLLWPKHDDAAARGDELGRVMVERLTEAIDPAPFGRIGTITPSQAWIPLALIEEWLNELLSEEGFRALRLTRENGILEPTTFRYEVLAKLSDARNVVSRDVRDLIGWINHDATVWAPEKTQEEKIEEVRYRFEQRWQDQFALWCAQDDERQAAIERAYNRAFRGFVQAHYSTEALPIARWRNAEQGGRTPHPYQNAGARRALSNGGGIIAYDVGLGKTITGLLAIAMARQTGFARRPIIVTPNTIAVKWLKDTAAVLPDYRVVVIGTEPRTLTRGARKGRLVWETDTPEARGKKWSDFAAGLYDLAIVTYTALPRTRVAEEFVRAYAERSAAIQRSVRLSLRNERRRQKGKKAKESMTEREEATLEESFGAWIAGKLKPQKGQRFDSGIAWHEIGIDMVVVDEAQNFKNLHLPEARHGSAPPKFMGSAGEGSDRAWQLDFRLAVVRNQNASGGGVFLLSATPAKNSPLEFYNLVNYVDPEAFARLGLSDPEQFIDRYCKIEQGKPSFDAQGNVKIASAVTGFKNTLELRSILFRFAEWLNITSPEVQGAVSLDVPEPDTRNVYVDMTREQLEQYEEYREIIRENLGPQGDSGKVLGSMSKMALVAIHPALDQGLKWDDVRALEAYDPHSPKIDACVASVLREPGCGHIVFVSATAAHRLVRAALMDAGIPAERIAVLNATTAPSSGERQKIADEFNGAPDAGIDPVYDVVIANEVAYEGIDLQRRTCAVHHLDLPWEPATLQQRNGRAVRQGNQREVVKIAYYIAKRSSDAMRLTLIAGKKGWMDEIVAGSDVDVSNPLAQADFSPEAIMAMLADNPDEARRALDEARRAAEHEQGEKLGRVASQRLGSADLSFRRSERELETEKQERYRRQGEEQLDQALRVAPAWRWRELAPRVRTARVHADQQGRLPIFEGLRMLFDHPERGPIFVEFGALDPQNDKVWARQPGQGYSYGALGPWSQQALESVHQTVEMSSAVHADPTDWPETDEQVRASLEKLSRYQRSFARLGFFEASPRWRALAWEVLGDDLVKSAGEGAYYGAPAPKVWLPVRRGRGVEIVASDEHQGGELLAPTEAGWAEFVPLAQGLAPKLVRDVARTWWRRRVSAPSPPAERQNPPPRAGRSFEPRGGRAERRAVRAYQRRYGAAPDTEYEVIVGPGASDTLALVGDLVEIKYRHADEPGGEVYVWYHEGGDAGEDAPQGPEPPLLWDPVNNEFRLGAWPGHPKMMWTPRGIIH